MYLSNQLHFYSKSDLFMEILFVVSLCRGSLVPGLAHDAKDPLEDGPLVQYENQALI